MPHALFLGAHVAEIVFVGLHLDWYIFSNFKSVCLQPDSLDGVVGHETHFSDAYLTEYLCAYTVVTLIGEMTESNIGIHRIHASLLEFVSLHFLHETYAATFLIKVYHSSATLFLNHLQGTVKLFAAVAAL